MYLISHACAYIYMDQSEHRLSRGIRVGPTRIYMRYLKEKAAGGGHKRDYRRTTGEYVFQECPLFIRRRIYFGLKSTCGSLSGRRHRSFSPLSLQPETNEYIKEKPGDQGPSSSSTILHHHFYTQ